MEVLHMKLRRLSKELLTIADALQKVTSLERIGNIKWLRGSGKLECKGKIIAITRTEEKILAALCDQRGNVVNHDDLVTLVMGADCFTATIRQHLANLRKKMGPAGDLIQNVSGRGYLLVTE